MKHYRLLLIILSSAILVACSREDILSSPRAEMSFTASLFKDNSSIVTKSADVSTVIPFGDGMALTIEESDIEDNYEDVATKGQVVTTENFSDLICRAGRMHITAFDRSTESSVPFISDYFKYDGQYWRPLQSMYWPNNKMDIYAFARPTYCRFPYDEEDRQDIYYPDSDVEDPWGFCLLHGIDPVNRTLYYDNGDDYGHEDLLFAKAESDPNHSGPLNLSFKHILTAVKFVTSSGIPSGTVKDISIRGIYGYEAIFHLDTEEWEFDDPEYRWGYTVPGIEYAYYYDDYRDWDYNHHLNVETSAGVEGTPISNEYQTLFVYPQKCGADSYISIDFQYNGETDVQTYELPLPDGFEFKMGKQITFSIGADGPDYTFSFSEDNFSKVDFTDFTSVSTEIPINSIKRPIDDVVDLSAPWKIASYQIGSNDPVEVNTDEVNTGDLLLKRNGNILQVTDKRVAVNPSTHEYWTGSNGDWSPAPYSGDPIDLSRFDAKSETVNAFLMTTANCYIIRHAGTYKLPLVYGNAVMNGIENVEAYYPAVNDSGGAHSYSCRNFPNCNGTPVSSAFIENNDDCIPTGCAVIWQDNGEIVSNLEIVGTDIGEITVSNKYDASTVRYLQFKVDQSTIHQGNALICIYKDKNSNGSYDKGESIWSWHIWITNNPDLLEQDIQITPQFTPDVYYFPIYCLGWIDPETYPKRDEVTVTLVQDESLKEISFVVHRGSKLASPSHGTFYEYGRNEPYYNDATWDSKTSYLNAWTGYDAMRLNEKSSLNISSQQFIKTIYDPSPIGYMLPKSLFQRSTYKPYINGLENGGTVSGYKTIYFTGSWDNPYGVVITDRKGRKIFFPRTGWCGYNRSWDDEYGIYVSSVKYNPSLSFKGSELISGFYNDDNVMRGSGAVRPVKQ